MHAVAAFLNGSLSEHLYLEQLEGFEVEVKQHLVCKSHESVYGLRQSPKIWGGEVRNFLLSINFEQCKIDPCTYAHHETSRNTFTEIYLDVHDLAIAGNNTTYVKSLIALR